MLQIKYNFIWIMSIASLCLLFLLPQKALADIFTGLETEPKIVLGESEKNIDLQQEILKQIQGDVKKTDKYIIKDPEDAIELQRLYLDADTIIKGYTVESEQEDFKAGIVDNVVTAPVTVVLKKIPAWHIPVEKTSEKISYIFDYDIRRIVNQQVSLRGDGGDEVISDENGITALPRHKVGFTRNDVETETLGVLEKPIYVALKYSSDTIYKKVVHFWNKPTQEWLPLPSTTDFENNLARAVIHLPYARLAVFDKADIYEGAASWYAFKDCYCAASNVYKRGTRLKVTNISGSPRHGRSIIVKVNDYGPDPNIHPDRPIDLDKTAYSQLAASLGSGLMMVRVEPIDYKLAEKYEF